MKVLIEIDEEVYKKAKETHDVMCDSVWLGIKYGTPLNGTNGEVLCMLFPNMHYTLSDKSPRVVTTIGVASSFDVDWWNAEYKGVE